MDSSRAFARGKGVEPKGVTVGQDAPFEVITKNAGRAELKVTLVGPEGKPEPITVKKMDDDTYACNYKPEKPGNYMVSIEYGDQPITDSPFSVVVDQEAAAAITDHRPYATGKGVEPSGMEVGQNGIFEVHTNGAPVSNLKVNVKGPDGAPRNATVKKVNSTTFRCGYMPKRPGKHTVDVTYDGNPIKDSPFTVDVGGEAPESPISPAPPACKAFASGMGVEPNGPKAGQPAPFIVNAKEAGMASLNCHISGPGEKPIPLEASSMEPGIFALSYTPNEPGPHTVTVTYGGQPIQKSPFTVNVRPAEAVEDMIGQLQGAIFFSGLSCVVMEKLPIPICCNSVFQVLAQVHVQIEVFSFLIYSW
jgi:filamin